MTVGLAMTDAAGAPVHHLKKVGKSLRLLQAFSKRPLPLGWSGGWEVQNRQVDPTGGLAIFQQVQDLVLVDQGEDGAQHLSEVGVLPVLLRGYTNQARPKAGGKNDIEISLMGQSSNTYHEWDIPYLLVFVLRPPLSWSVWSTVVSIQ